MFVRTTFDSSSIQRKTIAWKILERRTRAHLPRGTARSVSRERTTADCYRETGPRRGTGPRRRTGPRPRVSSGRSTASDCERIKTPTEWPERKPPEVELGSCKERRSYNRVVTASIFATEVYFRPRLAVSQSETRSFSRLFL